MCMRFLVFAYVASIGHGRRLRRASEHVQGHGRMLRYESEHVQGVNCKGNSSEVTDTRVGQWRAISMLLLAFQPGAAWQLVEARPSHSFCKQRYLRGKSGIAKNVVFKMPGNRCLPVLAEQGPQNDQTVEDPLLERPSVQLTVLLLLYLVSVATASKANLALPFVPNIKFAAEDVVGAAVLAKFAAARLQKKREQRDSQQLSSGSTGSDEVVPWGALSTNTSKLIETTVILSAANVVSGYLSPMWDLCLLCLIAIGVPLNYAQKYAWLQLLSHLAWVWMGVKILGTRLKPFFPPPFGTGRWIRIRWRTHWLTWVLGGYYAAVLGVNSLDLIRNNMYEYLVENAGLPPLEEFQPESVVARLISPGGRDIVALVVGFIAPCVTAPVFEEVLYRGFLLPALHYFMPLKQALPLHAAIFSLLHRDLTIFLPLFLLATLWGWLYIRSGNLVVTILIHAMWNSRFFLQSFFGGSY